MPTNKIFCGLCGFSTETALFEHLRETHGLSPSDYAIQCPGAPLFTAAFQEYVRSQGVHASEISVTGGEPGIRVTKELFGVKLSRAVAPVAGVPALDEQYHFDPALAQAVMHSLADNDRILLVGPTGSGKSSLIMQLAARLNWGSVRANLHGETSAADLLGQNKVKDGEVYFQYGLLPQAMKAGQLAILEEVDAADPGILFVLQGLREEGGTLTLADNGGEVIHPHPDFRLLATANTLGTGDEHGLYAGTQVMNASFLDRWSAVFQVDYLPESEEMKLVAAKTPMLEHALVDGIVKLAGAVRKAISEQQLYTTFSTRKVLAFARKIPSLGLGRALEVCILNRLPANDRAIVAELAQRHLANWENAQPT